MPLGLRGMARLKKVRSRMDGPRSAHSFMKLHVEWTRECEWNPVLKYKSLCRSQDELDEDRHLVVLKDHPQ